MTAHPTGQPQAGTAPGIVTFDFAALTPRERYKLLIGAVVPCHRVLAAGDRPGGFSAGGGALTKLRMLRIEGACPGGTPSLFDCGGWPA